MSMLIEWTAEILLHFIPSSLHYKGTLSTSTLLFLLILVRLLNRSQWCCSDVYSSPVSWLCWCSNGETEILLHFIHFLLYIITLLVLLLSSSIITVLYHHVYLVRVQVVLSVVSMLAMRRTEILLHLLLTYITVFSIYFLFYLVAPSYTCSST